MLERKSLLLIVCWVLSSGGAAMQSPVRVPPERTLTAPDYKVDPDWPKPLPNNWIIGMARGLAVDKDNHIWVLHGRNSVNADELGAAQTPPRTECCTPAPPVRRSTTSESG